MLIDIKIGAQRIYLYGRGGIRLIDFVYAAIAEYDV